MVKLGNDSGDWPLDLLLELKPWIMFSSSSGEIEKITYIT